MSFTSEKKQNKTKKTNKQQQHFFQKVCGLLKQETWHSCQVSGSLKQERLHSSVKLLVNSKQGSLHSFRKTLGVTRAFFGKGFRLLEQARLRAIEKILDYSNRKGYSFGKVCGSVEQTVLSCLGINIFYYKLEKNSPKGMRS